MGWKVGDTALCINATPYTPDILKRGKHYVVQSLDGSCCTTRIVTKSQDILDGKCIWCHKNCFGFVAQRFIKLAGDDIDVDKEEKLEKTKPLEYGGVVFHNLREKVKSSG